MISGNIYGQNYCGTPERPFHQWMQDLDLLGGRPYLNDSMYLKGSVVTFWVPMHYHVMRKSDGTGQYYQEWLLKMNCELNEAYKDVGVQFYIDKISYHNSNSYYKVTYSNDYLISDFYGTRNHCNVYLTDDPAGNCGYTRRPNARNTPEGRFPIFLAASATNIGCCLPGGKTLIHEMGHWLDLPHTFYGWEGIKYDPNNSSDIPLSLRESVPRKGDSCNCLKAGDGFCDTEPDYISDRWNCPNNTWFVDPFGNRFKQVGWNYMCYADDNCISNNGFSEMQKKHMSYAKRFPDRSDLALLPVPPNPTIKPVDVIYSPKNGDKILKNKALLSFEKIDSTDFYLVSVAKGTTTLNSNYQFTQSNQSFLILDTIITTNSIEIPAERLNASDNSFYYWRVIPFTKMKQCETSSKTNYFKATNLSIDFNKTDISCFGKEDGSIQIVNGATNYNYSINGTSFSNSINNLKSGVYPIVVKDNTQAELCKIYVNIEDLGEPKWELFIENNICKIVGKGGKLPYKYEWNDGQRTENVTLYSNIKSVTVSDANNCTIKTFKIGSSALQQNSQNSELFEIINPLKLNEFFNFKVKNVTDNKFLIKIFDNIGRELHSSQVNMNNNTVSTSWKPTSKGIYFLEIVINNKKYDFKLIAD